MPTDSISPTHLEETLPPDFSGQVLPPAEPFHQTVFQHIHGDTTHARGEDTDARAPGIGGGNDPPAGPQYEDVTGPASPAQDAMNTLPPLEVLPPPPPTPLEVLILPPPPPPTVESISVGTDTDLKVLYSREIVPGIEPEALPWGLTIVDIVQYLLDFPTLHVDDVLRRILLDPRYPRGTQRDFANLSTVTRTAQDVLRNVASRCVRSM